MSIRCIEDDTIIIVTNQLAEDAQEVVQFCTQLLSPSQNPLRILKQSKVLR
jgi:hypothetical protein